MVISLSKIPCIHRQYTYTHGSGQPNICAITHVRTNGTVGSSWVQAPLLREHTSMRRKSCLNKHWHTPTHKCTYSHTATYRALVEGKEASNVQVHTQTVALSADGPLATTSRNLVIVAVNGVETHITTLAARDILLVPVFVCVCVRVCVCVCV